MDDPFELLKQAAAPSPENDPFEAMKRPAESVVPQYIDQQFKQGRSWSEVEPELKAAQVNPEPFRQSFQLQEERQKRSEQGIGMGEAFMRSSVPIGSAIYNEQKAKEYTDAMGRFNQNKASQEDIATIADYERKEQIDAERNKTLGGRLVSLLGQAPAIAGEALGAGKVVGLGGKLLGIGKATSTLGSLGRFAGGQAAATPLMPSLYMKQAADVNIREGRAADDIRGFPTPLGMAYAQNLVLGQLAGAGPVSRAAGAVPTLAGRALARGGIGAVEMAGVNTAAGIADEFLPKQYQTETKYGVVGKLARGEYGEALKDATVDTLGFALFAALHDHPPTPNLPEQRPGLIRAPFSRPITGELPAGPFSRQAAGELPRGPGPRTPTGNAVMDSFVGAMDYMKRQGWTAQKAAAEITNIRQRFDDLIKTNPNAGPAEARKLFEKDAPGPLRDFAHAMADVLPTTTTARPGLRRELAPFSGEAEPSRPVVKTTSGVPESPTIAPERASPEAVPEAPEAEKAAPGPLRAEIRRPEVTLGPAEPGKLRHDGLIQTRHAIHDQSGEEIGHILVRPSGGTLHVDWTGVKGAGAKDVVAKGSMGAGITRSLLGQLATAYPEQFALKFTPAEGRLNAGKEKWIDLDKVRSKMAESAAIPKLTELMDQKRLGLKERHVIEQRLLGRGHKEIGADPQMQVSKQRVEQIERKALAKLGYKGGSLADLRKQSAEENAAELIARGKNLDINAVDPTGNGHRKSLKKNAVLETHHELWDRVMMAEAERGLLTDERSKELLGILKEIESGTVQDSSIEKLRNAAATLGKGKAGPARAGRKAQGEPVAAQAPAAEVQPPSAPYVNVKDWLKQRTEARLAREAAAKAAKLTPEQSILNARMAGTTNPWTRAELEAQRGGTVTFGREVRNRGGIDPESLSPEEKKLVTEHFGIKKWSDVPIFRDTKGERGRFQQSLDQMAAAMGRDHPELAGTDGPSLLLQKILDNVPYEIGAEHFGKQMEEYDRREEEAFQAEKAAEQERNKPLTKEEEAAADISFDFGESPKLSERPGARKGAIKLPTWDDVKNSNVAAGITAVHDEWTKARGSMFPATARLSEPVADRAATLVAAPAFAEAATRYILRAVFAGLKREAWAKFYTAHIESRLQFMKSLGHNAISVIGPDSPIQTLAEYQRIVRSPAFQRYLDRWKKVVVPIMDKHYRDSQGLAPNAPIHQTTQLPGYPINLVRVRQDGSVTSIGQGGSRVHPERVTQRRLGFARKASGESPFGYETNPEKALLSVMEQGMTAAARANLDREIVSQSVGVWGGPGQVVAPVTKRGTPMTAVRHVDPQPGTQSAVGSQKTLWLDPKMLEEYHNAIGIGNQFRIPGVTPLLNAATRVALVSTVEVMYHSANLAMQIAKPYVLRNFVREFVSTISPILKGRLPGLSDPQLKRLMDLAEQGSTKAAGFQSGFLLPESLIEKYPWLGKADVTRWGSRFLDYVDSVMRLASDAAFDMAAKKNLAQNTPKNKRDFLNALGNYLKNSQAMLVRLARGTGAGPFATAGVNTPIQSIRSLWLSPAMTATSPAAQARLRMHVAAKLAGVVGLSALVNWLLWGRPDGDDSVPFGAVKVTEDEGRSYFIDPIRFMGPRRGLNVTGLGALIEGQRTEASTAATVHKARMDVQHGLLHPFIGPGVQSGTIMLTGHSPLGTNVAGTPEPGGTVEWENMKAALKNANPSLATLIGADRVRPGEAMPFFPLTGKGEGFVGEMPEGKQNALRLAAPYVMSRKQMPLWEMKMRMESEAAPKREIPLHRR